MNQNITIAVLGGGGRTGKYLVTQLIEKGYRIKILLRNPKTFEISSPLIEVIQGDAMHCTVLHRLMDGCQAVISTIGQRPGDPLIAEQATRNILKAMAYHCVKRYVLVAGINIDTPLDQKGPETVVATNWMKANYPDIQEDRQRSYGLLVNSNVDWTLVRVPFIEFGVTTNDVLVSLDDCLGTKVDASNIAAFLIKQLSEDSYFGKAPFICNR